MMSRLVQDNAWYRKENEALSRRLSTADLQETKARQQLSELIKERQGVEQERRALQRYLETLREDKIDMEYQSKHLGYVRTLSICKFPSILERHFSH